MVRLFLLIVDRDGEAGRRQSLNALEEKARMELPTDRYFLAENAWQEIEVWILAGHDLTAGWRWNDIRQEIHPKENYFEPFARDAGLKDEPGGGRKTLANKAATRYARIKQLCQEDVASLEERIRLLREVN